ncbi:BCCT family transporter [Pontibacterium sp.]|uniref:BCCT family transporter n=1 Tax=Pontibacterium sp. TaxID=2036026 RepID=UPI003516632D
MTTETTQDLRIETADSGFYKGFNQFVTIGSKVLILSLALWAMVLPEQAGKVLSSIQGVALGSFGAYYIYAMALFAFVCFAFALIPSVGKIKLGSDDAEPEFSRFSWFSMMFGAGIGIGMLTYATGEPIYHFASNPDIIAGVVEAKSEEALDSVYRYSFLHWGLSAWSVYALVGLSLAYFGFNRKLPLTIRSGLSPLFGSALNGKFGHIVDISAVLATILGIAVTIGFGISQFASGIYNISGAEWMMDAGKPTTAAMLSALVVVMGLSTLSAVSGVGKGIKWLSNLNMSLSFILLAFFLLFGSTWMALELLGKGIVDYLITFIPLALNVEDKGTPLGDWQSGWTIFYWAWWIAFAPFVGMFFARISKGRTVREFILGSIMIPTLVCFIWFTFVGGTALDLELSGQANGQILGADISAQIYEVLNLMLSPAAAKLMSVMIVVLLLTFLVTSADSAVLVVNTINAGGSTAQTDKTHIIIWGSFLTAVIAALLVAGGLGALKTAMIIGALPFSFIMILMTVSLVKAMHSHTQTETEEQTAIEQS